MTNVDKRRTAREKVAPALLIVQLFFGSRAFAQTLLASSPWPTQRHDQARLALTTNAGPGAPLVSTVAAVSDNIGGEPTIAPDGSFYYVGRNSGIVALDANLHPKWTFATGGGNSGSTVRADGTVYAGGMSLWAIKPDGTLLWQIPSNYPYAGTLIFTTPAIASDGSVWTTRTDTQQVLKVDPITGVILLTVPLAGVASAAAMGPDGTIYVGGSNNSVTALNQNGSVKWSAAVTGPVYGTPMVHSNGQVLVAYNGVIQAINANGTLAWSFQEPAAGTGFSVNALAEGPDGTILAPDTGSYLYALNPANGALKWTYSGTLGDGFSQAGFFVDSAGNIFITGYNYAQRTLGLYSISSTGIRNWFLPLSGSVGVNSPILDANGNLYIGAGLSGTAGQITKLSPPSPTTFLASSPWPTQRHDVARSALTGNAAPSAPLVSGVSAVGDNIGGEPTIAPDGSFYFVGRSSGIIALDANLNQKWTFATGGGNSGSTVRADGTVYAGGMSLWAIKPDGTLLWQIPSNYPYAGTLIFTTPVIASDGSVWTTRTDTQQVLKVNPNTGAVQITLSLAGVASGAALGADGTIYVGGSGGQVYAIKQDGSIKWSAAVGGPIYGTPMLHSSGMVIVAYNSAIQALTSNGALAWSFQEPPAGTGFGVNALAQGPDGTIYAPDTGSYLYALNPATGALKWTYSGVLGDGFSQAGFFVDNTGSVFITGYNYAQRTLGLYSINNAGTRNWFLPLSGSPGVNSPVLDANGNLYVGAGLSATTGQITKISPPSPATFLAVSPWPTQRHDQARLALTANAAPSVPIISTTAAIGDNIGGEPSIAPDGSFYLVGRNSGIIALDASLNPKWTFATGGGNAATTVRADGTVYAGGQNLWAVKPNGTLLWEIASNYPYPATLIFTTPVIASDGSLWTTRTDTHQVFKIDPNSGAIRQTVNLAGVVSAASLGPDGTLYVGGSNNMLYALNQDGSVKWSVAVSGPVYGTPLVHSNGMIYVAYNGSIQAINANGTLAWSFQEPPAGTGFSVNALAEGPDGTVYAPDTGAYLYAFNPNSGALKWTYAGTLGDGFSQAGFFVDSAGSVFITGYNYAQRTLGLYSISNAGARNWFLPLSGSAGVNSPVLDANGNLYIGAGLNASVGQMVKIAPGFVVASTTTLAGRPELAITSVMPGLSVVSISTVTPTVAVALASATATGLQLVSNVFEISPSTAFTPAANITFRFDPSIVIDTSTLAIFRFDGVSWSSAGVISSQLVALGSDPQVTATLAHSSYYALFRAGDHLPPRTNLGIGMPNFSAGSNTYVSSSTPLTLTAADDLQTVGDARGIGVAQTFISVDSAIFSNYTGSFALTTPGTHSLSYYSVDKAGNRELPRNGTVFVDTTTPALTLLPATGSVVVDPTPRLSVIYTDSGSGVSTASVSLSLDGVSITTQAAVFVSSANYSPTFALAQGTHTFSATTSDRVGNTATAASTFLLDTVPPVTTLLVDGLAASTTTMVIVSTDSLSFTAYDMGTGVAQTLFVLDGGSMTVYTSTFSLSAGNHTLAYYSRDVAGNMENAKTVSLAVLSYDIIPPSVTLTPPSGSTITTTTPSIVAAYSDIGRGVDISSVKLFLDGVTMTTQAAVTASSAAFMPPFALTQASHIAIVQVADLAGNRTVSTSTFFVDSIPPVTILLVNGLTPSATNLIIVSTDILSFIATDAGTGVAQTLYSIDGSSETVFATSFSLTAGAHALAFHSRDNAGNLEGRKNDFISVRSTSTAEGSPPTVSLTFPSPTALGVEQTLSGVVNIRGAVYDANLQSWTLSVAPGIAVSSGFTAITAGATNVSGQMATWNTSSLAGYFTLKLSARNTSGGTSVVTAPVFVGKPILDFSIGKHDSNAIIASLKNPQGIVVRLDGLIWVAVDDDSKLLLITSSGSLVASVGNGLSNNNDRGQDGDHHGHDGGHHGQDGDHQGRDQEEHVQDSSVIRFSHPRGLSLDATGNLYVADRGRDRVIELSIDGSRLITEFSNGLKAPNDAVVDTDGTVYVADTGHQRVRVFGSNGAVLRDIPTGSGRGESQPWGVALSSRGLWVSDRAQKAAYLFSRQGALLTTLTGVGRVRGASVDHVEALYVVDRDDDRVRKFDPLGSPLLNIGSRGDEADEGRRGRAFLSDPSDAAIGPDGALWVADSGHDRIVRYELPPVGGGNGSLTVNPTPHPKAPAARAVDPADGGKVERDDGTGVRVPPNALASALQLSVQSADVTRDADAKQKKRLVNGIAPISEEVEYGPEGTQFQAPVTITIPYDPAQLALAGITEEQLKIHYWNPSRGDWEALNSTVDKAAKIVSALTTHFSVYQVMGPGIGVAAADATFGFKAAYVFPNPVRGVSAATIRIQPGLADSVEVHIYDLSGRKVHSSSAFTLSTLDDGNGLGAQFTYDHVWDVSGVGSGVYTYVITARKAGQSDIHKTGKIGVVK